MKLFTINLLLKVATPALERKNHPDTGPVFGIVPPMLSAGFPLGVVALLLTSLAPIANAASGAEVRGIDDPVHGYWTRKPQDRFTKLKTELENGQRALDTSSDLQMLRSLLAALEVPVSSQMLVYSVTSLQKALVSPRRPRALYFNDDTYVGFIPGGRIEVISIDPELGAIFYIFDRLRPGAVPTANRTEDCMTCHAPHHMEETPGLVIESVVPGITGGGEKAFRRDRSGHDIPFEERFGGWHLTGAAGFPQHWGNIMLEYTPEGRRERTLGIGELFDVTRYALPSSDLLPQLLHEHQVGFVNRTVLAQYRTRSLLHSAPDNPATAKELDSLARGLVKYLLFADEVALPPSGVAGDPEFKASFLAKGPRTRDGRSLREFDLRTRLLQNRCSYMIYSPSFVGLAAPLKTRVYALLEEALGSATPDPDFAYLPAAEKESIRRILRETLPDLPPGWGEAARTASK